MLGAIFSTLISASLALENWMECALIHLCETAHQNPLTHSLALAWATASALQIECVLWSVFGWDIIYIFSLICKPRHGVLHATTLSLSSMLRLSHVQINTISSWMQPHTHTHTYKHPLLCLLHLLRTKNIWRRQFYCPLKGHAGEERHRFVCNLMVSRIIYTFPIAIQMCSGGVAPFIATANKCFVKK